MAAYRSGIISERPNARQNLWARFETYCEEGHRGSVPAPTGPDTISADVPDWLAHCVFLRAVWLCAEEISQSDYAWGSIEGVLDHAEDLIPHNLLLEEWEGDVRTPDAAVSAIMYYLDEADRPHVEASVRDLYRLAAAALNILRPYPN